MTNTTLNKFTDRTTQIKINPETYIKFDDSDHVMISNIFSEGNALRIKCDILLLLWDITDWKSLGDILDAWPDPVDHSKIMEHLANLYECKIIVTEESEVRKPLESGLSENLGSKIHINVENHHVMMKDFVRLAAYRRAIERAIESGKTVAMDLGCGSGILSFFAANAGAEKVYAVERRQDIIELAQALADDNEIKNIEFVQGSSSALSEDVFTPKPDVFISEILGNGILEENVLEFTLDARDRLCAPDAQLIPYKLDIYVFAYHSGLRQDKGLEVEEFSDLYGVDYSIFKEILCSKSTLRLDKFNPRIDRPITKPTLVKAVDFRTFDNPTFTQEFELDVTEEGNFTGYCGYFKAWLDEDTSLTNSPWAPDTHWTQMIYTMPVTREVKPGDKIKMDIVYDGNLRIRALS